MEATVTQRATRRSHKNSTKRREKDPWAPRKVNLTLEPAVDTMLSTVATFQGLDRSSLASSLLRSALAKYDIAKPVLAHFASSLVTEDRQPDAS